MQKNFVHPRRSLFIVEVRRFCLSGCSRLLFKRLFTSDTTTTA